MDDALISIHALLAESDAWHGDLHRHRRYFYPRSPCGERRKNFAPTLRHAYNFYPRSPCGERPPTRCSTRITANFYPRSPCGERRGKSALWQPVAIYFYPRSPCGERLDADGNPLPPPISIHALLAESDLNQSRTSGLKFLFLSTLSLRRATTTASRSAWMRRHFYPRSPCGERLLHAAQYDPQTDFYPRSPCGERPTSTTTRATPGDFYPRSPCGERRYVWLHLLKDFCISIHALLAESDQFLDYCDDEHTISIHALLAESDGGDLHYLIPSNDFYPRSPCGERLFASLTVPNLLSYFYPRSPCGERLK